MYSVLGLVPRQVTRGVQGIVRQTRVSACAQHIPRKLLWLKHCGKLRGLTLETLYQPLATGLVNPLYSMELTWLVLLTTDQKREDMTSRSDD